jgi:hypothetical protein
MSIAIATLVNGRASDQASLEMIAADSVDHVPATQARFILPLWACLAVICFIIIALAASLGYA